MDRIKFNREVRILTDKGKEMLDHINPDYSKIPDEELTLYPRKVFDDLGTFDVLDDFKKHNQHPIVTPTLKVCPICGSPMMFFNSHVATFIGCAGYPDCKYRLMV